LPPYPFGVFAPQCAHLGRVVANRLDTEPGVLRGSQLLEAGEFMAVALALRGTQCLEEAIERAEDHRP